MKNFVISLKTATKRREHICKEFGEKNIDFEFFDAITPDQNQYYAEKFGLNLNFFDLKPTEISCFLSHIYLWFYAEENNLEYIAIFEDDIYLGENANLFLNNFNWIPKNTDILKLEAFDDYIEVNKSTLLKTVDGREIYHLVSKHIGGAGYIMSHRIINKILVRLRHEQKIKPLDHYLFEDLILDKDINIVQILPALCIQDFIKNNAYENFSSSLEEERRKRFNSLKIKLSIPQKIKREILRLFSQFKGIFRKIMYRKKVIFR